MVSIAINENKKTYKDLSDQDFETIYFTVCNYLNAAHEITVIEKPIVDEEEYLGSYDTKKIAIVGKLSPEHKLFLVAHLFGHCVQWCTKEKIECEYIDELLLTQMPSDLPQSEINKLKQYEYEAAGYAIELLNNVSDFSLNQWFSDLSHADWEYFLNLRSFKDKSNNPFQNLKFGSKLIPPQKIPSFKPKSILPRYAY